MNPIEEQSEPSKPKGVFAKVRYYEEYLDRKLGIESHSLDRVHPENRQSPSPTVMAFMWASATMNISCFSTGFMGKEFGLSLGQTIPIIIFATLLGAMVTVGLALFSSYFFDLLCVDGFQLTIGLGLVRDNGSRDGITSGCYLTIFTWILSLIYNRLVECN